MSSLIQTAQKLLQTNGESVTVQSPQVAGGVDPITGDPVTPVAGTTIQSVGYLGRYMSKDIDGTAIQANDGRLIMAATTPRISEGWNVTVDSKTYRIIKVNPIRKAGQDIILIMQVRI